MFASIQYLFLGHYTSFSFNMRSKSWVKNDDSVVINFADDEYIRETAATSGYVFFYVAK